MQVGSRASTQDVTELGEARSRLEGFLESEVQADAERHYETRHQATRRDARNAEVVSLVLLVVGELIGVVTSAVVGKGIIAGEGELRASEAFSRSVIESSPDCVKVLDPAGRLLRMNANGLTIMEIDDVVPLEGRLWVEVWPEQSRGDLLAALAAARAGGIGRFQGACPTAKGTPRFWDVVVAPIRDADGRTASLVAVSRDVTD